MARGKLFKDFHYTPGDITGGHSWQFRQFSFWVYIFEQCFPTLDKLLSQDPRAIVLWASCFQESTPLDLSLWDLWSYATLIGAWVSASTLSWALSRIDWHLTRTVYLVELVYRCVCSPLMLSLGSCCVVGWWNGWVWGILCRCYLLKLLSEVCYS